MAEVMNVYHSETSQSLTLASWSQVDDFTTGDEGLELIMQSESSAIESSNNLEDYDLTEESEQNHEVSEQHQKQQRRKIFKALRRIFPKKKKKKSSSPYNHDPLEKEKIFSSLNKKSVSTNTKLIDEERSIAATECSSLVGSVDADGEVSVYSINSTYPTSSSTMDAEDDVSNEDLLEFMRFYLEYKKLGKDVELVIIPSETNSENGATIVKSPQGTGNIKVRQEQQPNKSTKVPSSISLTRASRNTKSLFDDEITLERVSETKENGEDNNDIPLMQARLFKTGVVKSNSDFEFVQDKVSKEVLALEPQEEKKTEDNVNVHDEFHVSHVKTGVWEVLTFANDKDGTPNEPFYVVTGVSMDDRVDTKKLRKAIFAGQTYNRRPKLSLAPTDIAEELAGYKSGTMAPILHTVDSKLFIEETIANVKGKHKINVGSGMFGKCLSLDADKFLQIAKSNPKGFETCSLIAKKKNSKK